MADNFSLDDILAEVEHKKSSRSTKPENRGAAISLDDAPPSKKVDPSVTSILDGDKIRAASRDVGVTAILNDLPIDFPAEERPAGGRKRDILKELDDEQEALLTTGSIDIEDDVKPEQLFTPPKKLNVKKRAADPKKKQRELKQRQLEKEEQLDDPDDLIDAINPLEVKSKAANDFNEFLSGDTMGIAGNDLRMLAAQTKSDKAAAKKPDTIQIFEEPPTGELTQLPQKKKPAAPKPDVNTLENTLETPLAGEKSKTDLENTNTVEEVKTYVPQKDKQVTQEQKPLTEKERRSNTELLRQLNQAIEKKREEEINKQRTLGLHTIESDGDALKGLRTPTQGLNIDYDSKVIRDTGVLQTADSKLIEAELAGRRKRKIRDFMLESEEDEQPDEEDENSVEFDSYDSTGQIWGDLCESHKGLKIRLLLMLILTAIVFITGMMSEISKNTLAFSVFGIEFNFLSPLGSVEGFVYFNLIVGVLGMALCSSVIISGISKLFRARADCDTLCSVTAVVSLLTALLHLSDTEPLLVGRAYLFISAAMASLTFNTLGKLTMIVRAKRNFRFISGDSVKYSAHIVENAPASALTKGIVSEVPWLAAMRKTEFLTDFLHNSYCEDRADRICRKLAPISILAALVFGVLSFLLPNGTPEIQYNFCWATTVANAILAIMSPISVMFVVNVPLARAGKALGKSDSVVLGYSAAERFSETNSILLDAGALFPAGTVVYSSIKHCKQPNSINNIALDQAIILAASLAIKSGSVMSSMFKDMINYKDEILVKVDNCVFEDNMGVLGWFGNKRMIMGNREQMKHHDIKLPDQKKIRKYSGENTETVYLAVGGEIVIMFFVELLANSEVKSKIQALAESGVSIAVKTTDSIVTVAKIAEAFDIPPEQVRVLPYSMHEQYNTATKYVSRGNGALSCNGTFTSFAGALLAVKKLVRDINLGSGIMLAGAALGAVCTAAFALSGNFNMVSPLCVIVWNFVWFLAVVVAQSFRKY